MHLIAEIACVPLPSRDVITQGDPILLLTTYYLTTFYLLLTTYYLLLTSHFSLLTTYYLLLTTCRNVVIQGDPMSVFDKHGGHIMLHSRTHKSIVDRSKGESLTARLENMEVRYAGQMGRLGRYAVHWHMIGAVRNSYIRHCSVHHTYNRMVALHGVHYLRVQNNVGFEIMGHSLFVEGGLSRVGRVGVHKCASVVQGIQ